MTKKWLGPVVLLAMLVFVVAVYPSLPERVPTHWNLQGEADDWMDKWPGAFLHVAIAAGVWLLLIGLRKVDPRRRNYERFEETFWLIANLMVLFMAVMQTIALAPALGWPVDPARGIVATLGVLLLVLGNYMPRIRSNWWMGIRTPWTLSSERVWRETHRVGGAAFVVAGLLLMASAVLPGTLRGMALGAAVSVAAVVPLFYSYISWRREQRENAAGGGSSPDVGERGEPLE